MPLPIFTLDRIELDRVSFSRALTFYRCPYRHHLDYILKKDKEDTVYTVFGTLIGEALEQKKKYNNNLAWLTFAKKFFRFLVENDWHELVKEKDRDWRNWVRAGFQIYNDVFIFLEDKFPGYELVDFEHELYEPIEGTNMKFKGYIDFIIKWQDKYYIMDFKTVSSFYFWKQNADTYKLYQVALYKHFFCAKTGIDPSIVETSYMLLRRNYEKDKFSVELYEQTSGPKKLSNSIEWLKKQAAGIESGIRIKRVDTCDFCSCGAKKVLRK